MNWSEILEEELRWREAELASLKRIVVNNKDNECIYRCMLRSIWVLLYAHYEGFTKFCWELLLDQIQSKKVFIDELRADFLVLALEKQFRKLRGNTSSTILWEFFHNELPQVLHCEAVFDSDCRPDTGCNLWPNVFKDECAKVGITSIALETMRTRIKTLVSRRNDIAHGKRMTIKSVDEYMEYERVVSLLMHDLAIQVPDILERQTYKKANNRLCPIDKNGNSGSKIC